LREKRTSQQPVRTFEFDPKRTLTDASRAFKRCPQLAGY
jgi:hypothetical protein